MRMSATGIGQRRSKKKKIAKMKVLRSEIKELKNSVTSWNSRLGEMQSQHESSMKDCGNKISTMERKLKGLKLKLKVNHEKMKTLEARLKACTKDDSMTDLHVESIIQVESEADKTVIVKKPKRTKCKIDPDTFQPEQVNHHEEPVPEPTEEPMDESMPNFVDNSPYISVGENEEQVEEIKIKKSKRKRKRVKVKSEPNENNFQEECFTNSTPSEIQEPTDNGNENISNSPKQRLEALKKKYNIKRVVIQCKRISPSKILKLQVPQSERMDAQSLEIDDHQGLDTTQTDQFKCSQCYTVCGSLQGLEKHLAKCSGIAVYTCSKCKRVVTACNYKRHVKVCGLSLTCQECSKQFITRERLLRHMKRVHTDSFECAECDKVYKDKRNLKIHMTKYHESSLDVDE